MSKAPLFDGLLDWIDGLLVPNTQRMAKLKKRGDGLVKILRTSKDDPFEVLDAVTYGSVDKGTAISPCRDLDILLVLDPKALRTQRGEPRTPEDTIRRMAAVLRRRKAGLISSGNMTIRTQTHSVGIIYPKSNMQVDIVPALKLKGRRWGFEIPRRSEGEWIRTFPKRAREDLLKASKTCPPLLPAIRLLKGWRRCHETPLSSYAIEQILLKRSQGRRAWTLASMIESFLKDIAHHDARYRLNLTGRALKDPVFAEDPYTGENILGQLDRGDRSHLVFTAREALDEWETIQSLSIQGRRRQAAGRLVGLFIGEADNDEIKAIKKGDLYSVLRLD